MAERWQDFIELYGWAKNIVIIAALILYLAPKPSEIRSRKYLILFNMLRRVALQGTWRHNRKATRKVRSGI